MDRIEDQSQVILNIEQLFTMVLNLTEVHHHSENLNNRQLQLVERRAHHQQSFRELIDKFIVFHVGRSRQEQQPLTQGCLYYGIGTW